MCLFYSRNQHLLVLVIYESVESVISPVVQFVATARAKGELDVRIIRLYNLELPAASSWNG